MASPPNELTIVVASTNPLKIGATQKGFAIVFPGSKLNMIGKDISSDISNQPKSVQETFTGATNRTENAKKIVPEADFWVGIEGGMEIFDEKAYCFGWICILSKNGQRGSSRTASFEIPKEIVKIIEEDQVELGTATDKFFSVHDSKRKGGIIAHLTKDKLSRQESFVSSVVLALVPQMNEQLTF